MKRFKKAFDTNTAGHFATALILPLLLTTVCMADNISSSQIGVGLQNLINDLSTYVIVLSPTVGLVAAVYFVIRRGMADEQDGKMWNKRITTAVACAIGGALIGGIIKVISSYFA